MLLQQPSPGIQGARIRALLSPSRQAIVSPSVPRQAQSQQTSIVQTRASRRSIHGLCTAQATSPSLDSAAPEADAAATHAIVLGASVAGLLSAAALSDYVDSVTVLDKDAFVSERLSHEELKQVTVMYLATSVMPHPWLAAADIL